MMATGRVLISIATRHGLEVSHCDIPQAFIQSDIDRPIYIRLPAGIGVKSDLLDDLMRNNPGKGTVALRLVKSLYGLASAPSLFNMTISQYFLKLGYTRSRSDSTLFTKHDTNGWIMVTLFVDDCLITATDTKLVKELRAKLVERFGENVTWNQRVTSFLGIACKQSPTNNEFSMSAGAKVRELLSKISAECEPVI
mmetsp:Transcript_16095/g.21069  ORF Transcript_16095/g.21069 Transcript_16095/m.21069 type:complete len:196 (+) Transcript_16095:5618-6205(+)